MGKGLGRTEIVDPHLPVLVGGDKAFTHLDAFHAIAGDIDDQLGPIRVMPGALHRQVRKEVFAAFDHQGNVADHAVPVAGDGEIPGTVGGIGENFQVGLRRIGGDERQPGPIRVLLENHGIPGLADQ